MVRFREVRKLKNITLTDAAKMLSVAQSTLTGWENGQRSPSIENVIEMADLYNVSIDFLLGHDHIDDSTPISTQNFALLGGKPIWLRNRGWVLVNAERHVLTFPDGHAEPFPDNEIALLAMPADGGLDCLKLTPLSHEELLPNRQIWLEPISSDDLLREELRGWYRIIGRFAENENGNRFLLNNYGIKWLAFVETPLTKK